MKKNGFENVRFLNKEAQYYFLNSVAPLKIEQIEFAQADDFIDQFEAWARSKSSNELFLIWAVLKEIELDSQNLPEIVQIQTEKHLIPEWLASSGTLAFFTVHYLNKNLIESELKNRNLDFDSYQTDYELTIVTNKNYLKFNRLLLQELKLNVYEDQLNKSYFHELADTITTILLN